MASKYMDCIDNLISNNSKEVLVDTCKLLSRITTNILQNPGEEKYRSIKTNTNTFMNKILPIPGAIDCLLEIGFVEDDDKFVLPQSERLNDVRLLKNQLENVLKSFTENHTRNVQSDSISTKNKTSLPRISPLALTQSQSSIYQKIQSHFNHSLIFENPSLQRKALRLMPVKQFEEKALKRLQKRPQFTNRIGVATFLDQRDCELLELLDWFKKDFFTWTNNPACDSCGSESTVSTGMLQPLPNEIAWQAGRVEGYRCQMCGSTVRFPRYNHPEKLLETRTGRCGEWANCFTLLCRALKFEARHVLDFTDHVWTEVYSSASRRWLHCDPCENVCDKPLLYEKGWGKTLPLIVASSCDEIIDVTWRYTAKDIREKRMTMFNEAWLTNLLLKLCKQRRSTWPARKVKEVNDRFARELVEFITPRKSKKQSYDGRTTGSQQWRAQRGELGNKTNDEINVSNEITPTEKELANGVVHLRYFSANDHYIRVSNADEVIDGWESLAYRQQNIMRKEERDWKQVYLARNDESEAAAKGVLSWKIQLNSDKYSIEKAELFVSSTTFQSGRINWLLSTNKSTYTINNETVNSLNELNANVVSLHAFLSGGNGDSAWQHTQLFRQSLDDVNNHSLDIKITIRRK